MQDLRLALRSLARARALSAAAVATLALGIGGSTFAFTLVDGMLLRPLPFGERTPRLVTVHSTHPTQAQDWDDSGVSYPDLLDLAAASRTLAGLEGLVERNFAVAGDEVSERVAGASVTPGLFALLGVAPRLGAGFRPEDGALPGHEGVALLSDALWRRRFAADPAVVGRAILLNGRAVTVAGVMPPGFRFPERQDVWLPYAADRAEARDRRGFLAVGLLAEGAGVEAARAELAGIAGRLAERHPEANRGWGVHVLPLHRFYVTPATRRALTATLGAVVLVLLVACANVAALLLARGVARGPELATRTALGASRLQLAHLLLVESAVLAVAGTLVGAVAARWAVDAFVAGNPDPPPYWVSFATGGRGLAFLAAVAIVTTLACGLAPALRAARGGGALADERRGGVGRERQRFHGGLVAAQVAASLVLLVVAGLLTRSIARLDDADVGFDPTPLLSLRLYLAGDAYDEPAARARALERAVERLAALPGATAGAAIGAIPADDGGSGVRLVAERLGAIPGEEVGAQLVPASASLWETLGTGLAAGRPFTAGEAADPAADVAIVNTRLAAAFSPGAEAVGRRIGVAGTHEVRWLRVVGVAPDLVYEELGEVTPQSELTVYVPHVVAGWRTMAILVRTAGDPAALAAAVPAALRDVDPLLAPFDVLTMAERRRVTHWAERFLGRAFAGLAATALLLACVGTFGTTAYLAARRRRELGLRMALGATARDLVRLLLRRGTALAAAGVAVGLPLAAAGARLVEGLLFGVSAWEPGVWIVLPAALLAAVLVACWLPARRAAALDPATALRED